MGKSQVDMIFELATKIRDDRIGANKRRKHAQDQDEARRRLEALRAGNAARIKLTGKKGVG